MTFSTDSARILASVDDDQSDLDAEDTVLLEHQRPELKQPPLYRVLLVNDDYTPMEFVVNVLQGFFHMNREKATEIMLHVHTRGRGVCGEYSRDIAETKVLQVNDYSRQNEHPLLCVMEER